MAATPVAIVGDHLDRPSEAELATAITKVAAMTNRQFRAACRRVGLPIQANLSTRFWK